MREFIPSDYIDKEGNVYETVGENIREGKNGAVTSDFPTPEELIGGLVSSDGENYIVTLKNLADMTTIKGDYNLLRYNSNTKTLEYIPPNDNITNTEYASLPPTSNAVINYINSKLPYLQNAKSGIVTFSVSETGSVSITENEASLNIKTETSSDTLSILCSTKNKSIIDTKVLNCTTDSTSNFNVTVNTLFSVDNNSLFKVVNITNIKTITLLLSVEV